jgi:prepilin-type N-terminal cleavage/methylation domain-containing protein
MGWHPPSSLAPGTRAAASGRRRLHRQGVPARTGEARSVPLQGRWNPHRRGFTLLDLSVALLILAILAVALVPRWDAGTLVALQAHLLSHNLRHAQALAMTRGETLTVEVLGASCPAGCQPQPTAACYQVRDTAGVIDDPATGQPFCVGLDQGITLTGAAVSFDSLGRPVSGGALAASSQTLSLSSSTGSASVFVAPVSGFASVSVIR